jgi:nicotinamide-nucleotide amidase
MIDRIIKKLEKKRIKISVAESCTGGLLSSQITSISGSSKVFSMGLVTYSNQSKIRILNVPKKIIEKYGSVSEECCLSMVKNLKKISRADISISITGIAGPSGGSAKKPVGLVYVGIIKGTNIKVKKLLFNKNLNRVQIQKLTCSKVLQFLEESIYTKTFFA